MPVPLVQIQLFSRIVVRLIWTQSADWNLLTSVLLIAAAVCGCVSIESGKLSAACIISVYSTRLASVLAKLGKATGFLLSGVIFGRLLIP